MIRFNLLTVILFAGMFTSTTYGDDTLPNLPDKEHFLLFLLAGQSNMAGRGEVTDDDPEIHPRVLMLAKDGRWQYAVDPIHYDKKIAGVGLARSFAIEIANHDENITIGLVPAACGGSSIASWQPAAYFDKTHSHPYDDAISRTRRAMQDGTLSGIMWHQGESDSKPEKWPVYRKKLIELIDRFRTDLGTPEVPFIIGQLGQFEAKPWTPGRSEVDQAQKQVAKEISFAAFVSSDGLTSKPDNTHFNTESLREFGRRYAHAYLRVVRQDYDPAQF